MPKISITERHALPLDIATAKVKALAVDASSRYGITATWSGETHAAFKRTGLTGSLSIQPDRVTVDIDLSWGLFVFAGLVKAGVKAKLGPALRVGSTT